MRRRDLLAGLPLLATGSKLLAQNNIAEPESRRVALCIGSSQYLNFPDLPSALPDATLIGHAFVRLGFQTSLVRNPTYDDFLLALAKFRIIAESASLAVVYVAAHGFMQDGQSHILASDSPISQEGKRLRAIPEAVVLQAISNQPRQKILFLDTCRELPEAQDALGQTFTSASPYRAGVHVSYATQPRAPAFDGGTEHSPFAQALSAGLETPGLEISGLSRQVRLDVLRITSGVQIPWDKSSLLLPVVLNTGV